MRCVLRAYFIWALFRTCPVFSFNLRKW